MNIKKGILLLPFLLVSLLAHSQELLSPAPYAHTVAKSIQRTTLPFFDDFSNYSGAPDPLLWQGSDPFVNADYGTPAPTIGVVTLDAVDSDGRLHSGAGITPFSGDTLMSQFLRLDSIFTPARKRLQPSDSLYFSFYYLPGGGSGNMWERNGDAPESQDSLILEFYNPATQQWQFIWGTGGISVDTLMAHTGHAWQYVSIPILQYEYFSADFRFRFRNICSLEDIAKTGLIGNSDHWHLDYIYLNYSRNHSDQCTFDVAFADKAPTMLIQYQAMPARQYRTTDMKSSLDMLITNLFTTPVAVRYIYSILDEDGHTLHYYDGGNDNVPCYFPSYSYHTAQAHAHPVVDYQFPVSDSPRRYLVQHVVRGSVTSDDHPQNDTTTFQQIFADYYAYDDGVAENGYGLTSTSSRVRLAYGFQLHEADTLTAISICFNHTRNDETDGLRFYLCVWSSVDGKPGTLLYKDTERRRVTPSGLNQYTRYILEHGILVDGPIFVGLEQVTSDYLNIGFDRGHDARQHIFYQTSGNWQQSILSGALMMRPYFGYAATLGFREMDELSLNVYPNPTHGDLNIEYNGDFSVEVYDMKGSRLLIEENQRQLYISDIPKGVYILRLTDQHSMATAVRKIIVK